MDKGAEKGEFLVYEAASSGYYWKPKVLHLTIGFRHACGDALRCLSLPTRHVLTLQQRNRRSMRCGRAVSMTRDLLTRYFLSLLAMLKKADPYLRYIDRRALEQ
jgi:hypothetical protein